MGLLLLLFLTLLVNGLAEQVGSVGLPGRLELQELGTSHFEVSSVLGRVTGRASNKTNPCWGIANCYSICERRFGC